jgi:drug/metabolite transporter (DMT)-like permease
MTAAIFFLNVLVWGFSWIAITFQVNEAPPEVALLYRIALAAVMLVLFLVVTGRLTRVPARQHPFLALTGLSLFCVNYLLAYTSTLYIASGVSALVFSTVTVFNALNSMIFYGERQGPRFVLGVVAGIGGLACMFWRDLVALDLTSASLIGGGFMLAATSVFSLGNMMSRRNNAAGIDLPTATAWSMVWGSVFLLVYVLAQGHTLSLDYSASFYAALLYLALPGTVIGFLAYLEIVKRIGAPLAAFSAILYPAIALTVSTFVEGYEWTPASVAGLMLIAAGNMLVFMPPAFVAPLTRRLRWA